jgi:hypothetical protein
MHKVLVTFQYVWNEPVRRASMLVSAELYKDGLKFDRYFKQITSPGVRILTVHSI